MKKMIIAGAAAAALAAPAYAELEGDISLTYQNQYNYRGLNDLLSQATNSDDSVTAELNLAYSINDQWAVVGGATIGTLSNSGFDHNRYRGGVRYTTDCYTIELGYQHQDIRTAFATVDSGEVYLNVGTACPLTGGKLNLFVAHDVDVLEGTYVELSLSKSWELCEKTDVEVTVGVSYSFDYWDNLLGTGDDFNHAYITVGLPYQATENLVLTPFITYSEGMNALDTGGGGPEEEDEVTFGVKASVKF